MPFSLRTRLSEPIPARVALTVDGSARVRVQGSAYGAVRCGRERRWVFGAFDETFVVTRGARALTISAVGLGGFARRTLRFLGPLDLKLARPHAPLPRLRWAPYPAPRVPALDTEAIRRGPSDP